MCDLKRQLGKINVTPSLPTNITPLRKLGEKLGGYSRTDLNTPILGDFVNAFSSKHELPTELGVGLLRGIANYASLHTEDKQYPNERADWMMDLVRVQLPDFNHKRFQDWLGRCVLGTASWLQPPLCVEVPLLQAR